MKNFVFQTKVDIYSEIIKKFLYANGVNYVSSQNNYFFIKNGNSYHVAINGGTITIANIDANTAEHYVFPFDKPETVVEHYAFSSRKPDQVEITHSQIGHQNNELSITSSGAQLDMQNWPENCANKVVFFSETLLGTSLYDTLNKVQDFDSSTPVSVIQDVPKKIEQTPILEEIQGCESDILSDLTRCITR